MDMLQISHIAKTFDDHQVIRDISFTVPEHSVFGFLGQNGAGKTTMMKMILGLLCPDRGKITVNGETVRYGQTKTNRFIGYLPDVPEFYGFMKPFEYLQLCGEIAGMSAKEIKRKSEELLSVAGLEKADKKIAGFSRGMKQRLGIAQALLHEPKLLICDEPTSALDPMGRKEILDMLTEVRGKTTVIFSTHILSDVERICDHVAILHKGSLVMNGTLAEIRAQRKQNALLLTFAAPEDKKRVLSAESLQILLKNAEEQGLDVIIQASDLQEAASAILTELAILNIVPVKFEVLEPTLESLFLAAVS